MATKSLITINNNLMCGLDLETNGRDPDIHEIIQIALLPLDANLNPRKDLPVFDFKIRPKYPERTDMQALRISHSQLHDILETGHDSDKVLEIFYDWFNKLHIGASRKIVPLGHGISQFDINFIRHWLGGNENYYHYFHGFARDTQTVAVYWNDRNEFQAEQTLFPKLTLKEMCRKLEIDVKEELTHDALYDAWLAAQAYKKLCTRLFQI